MQSIFCLEGEWSASVRSRESVLPLLELLTRLEFGGHFYRSAVSRRDFEHHLKKLTKTSATSYPVLYLACHGDEGSISLGVDDLTLEELGDLLAGKLADRVVYFASCLVGSTVDDRLRAFAKLTGARAVVGYDSEVDWLDSASFDLLVLARMVEGWRSDSLFKGLLKRNESQAKALGLVVATKAKVHRAKDLKIAVA